MAKILIVEDETAIAENLEALLSAKGYQVLIANDGAEAVAKARKERPDVVLLDVMLPKLGGFDVCKMIVSDPNLAKSRVIIVTGLGRMGDVESGFQSGAFDYIIKPFDSERLLKKIEKALAAA